MAPQRHCPVFVEEAILDQRLCGDICHHQGTALHTLHSTSSFDSSGTRHQSSTAVSDASSAILDWLPSLCGRFLKRLSAPWRRHLLLHPGDIVHTSSAVASNYAGAMEAQRTHARSAQRVTSTPSTTVHVSYYCQAVTLSSPPGHMVQCATDDSNHEMAELKAATRTLLSPVLSASRPTTSWPTVSRFMHNERAVPSNRRRAAF